MAAVRAAMSGRSPQGDLEQFLLRRVRSDQVQRDQRAADRLEPHRRVEIEAVGEPGRGDGESSSAF